MDTIHPVLIEKHLDKHTGFLKGVSEPVNKALMDIFIKCDFCEESGHGVPAVVNAYGNDAYEFSDNFIDVTIPFDKTGFESQNVAQNVAFNEADIAAPLRIFFEYFKSLVIFFNKVNG